MADFSDLTVDADSPGLSCPSRPLKNGLLGETRCFAQTSDCQIACLGGPAAACCRVADVENGHDGLFQWTASSQRQKPSSQAEEEGSSVKDATVYRAPRRLEHGSRQGDDSRNPRGGLRQRRPRRRGLAGGLSRLLVGIGQRRPSRPRTQRNASNPARACGCRGRNARSHRRKRRRKAQVSRMQQFTERRGSWNMGRARATILAILVAVCVSNGPASGAAPEGYRATHWHLSAPPKSSPNSKKC